MPVPTLSLRELNRALLARQLLLARVDWPVPSIVERLVGLQAQLPVAPYVGLWTRQRDFRRDNLAALLAERTIIKVTMMRGTLHLMMAADYLALRATIQPALTTGWAAVIKNRGAAPDLDPLLAAARRYIGEQPRTFAELSAFLTERWPETDVGAMRLGVRTHLPLVQVPVDTGWSFPGNPRWTLADSWLDPPIPSEDDLRGLIIRYLRAFGPASVTDIQTWSGLPKLKEFVDTLKPDLAVYRDEQGRELLDLPDQPLPAADAPAPERFLPEFDNILLSHSKRTRIVVDAHRARVYLPGLRVAPTFLVDGFVAGTWQVEEKKGVGTLVVEPFAALPAASRDALAAEGEQLVRFLAPDVRTWEVRFAVS